ncbi:MAG: hypothetical protein AAF385_10850 [Pseudomonadota bacterium]
MRVPLIAKAVLVLCFVNMYLSTASNAAGIANNQTVDKLMMDEIHGQKLFIKMSGTVSTPATCSTHPSWDFVLDTSTEHGTQMYAILVNAHANNLSLSVIGTDNCNVNSSVETLRRFELE